ncbi:major facilitator superfamily domain-containing protein [Suillus clintonianus]|uniref:major facilitator superfamily domain-containing protein n=1 Tax=Suillus clintonianus TaxID=1904413 RepID=UPI001B87458D|nr:major facilitator superfamily domain-containing protein [Suillus clintonianus]KAG2144467.1 major facilitator superfamily domain-containing protein [Suillus clintonianus]
MSSPLPPSLDDDKPKKLPLSRKLVLLVILCLSQFMDTFSTSALLSAIPKLQTSMGMNEAQSTWVISAFRLTFSSFLLISGRLSDVYNPKTVFIGGASSLGILSLCAGFVDNTIPILVFRAMTGIASAMTIPSAIKLLVKIFPDPLEQARAMGFFSSCGAIANISGVVVGAMFVQWVSYHWVFWFVTCVALPVALVGVFIIPSQIGETADSLEPKKAKWKTLDLVGIVILTVAFILFIFAITSGSTVGWKSPMVLVLLIVSILMMVGFFYWETLLPANEAAIPPQTWFYSNFSVLLVVGFLCFWWNAVMFTFSILWQNVFGWSVMSSAVHMIPIGIIAFATSFTSPLSRIFSPKWIILTGLSLCMVATVLLALGGGKPENYWPYVFPAFSIGSVGVMLLFTHSNIAIYRSVPSSKAGTVGAIYSSALQLGSGIGLAAMSAIETSVEATHGGSHEYAGRAATFWFLLGVVALQFISLLVFYDRSADHKPQPTHDSLPTQQITHSDEKLDEENVTTLPELS